MSEQARDTYNIRHWSAGYFDINTAGELCVHAPSTSNDPGPLVSLPELTEHALSQGLRLPLLLRFTHILSQRVQHLQRAFHLAMQRADYTAEYTALYPIKVNQQRHVVEGLLGQTQNTAVGLEAGSKPELLAILALAPQKNTTLVCNGYKDREYIRLALLGQQMGHRVFIIIEKLSELALVQEQARALNCTPRLGARLRLASVGKGKWQNSGGSQAKFGLSASQLLTLLEQLKAQDALPTLQLLHCHIGSQIANIQDMKTALTECAQFYVALRQELPQLQCVDIGGGLGVDYEGTHSRSDCSMNYSIEEYAEQVVNIFSQCCHAAQIPPPDIMTESGRAMTAHHALLVTNILGTEAAQQTPDLSVREYDSTELNALIQLTCQVNKKTALETYHRAQSLLVSLQHAFVQGEMSLHERACFEQHFVALCKQLQSTLQPSIRTHKTALEHINQILAHKYFCNFSIFQSIPDVWAIDQIFPVMPLSHLNQPLSERAVIEDITCDSDGRIDYYIDAQSLENTLPVPHYDEDNPYLMGVFLVGAYQEILGDKHNLFGDTDSVHVHFDATGQAEFIEPTAGETIEHLLQHVQFNREHLLCAYQTQFENSTLSLEQQKYYLDLLSQSLDSYTYLA